MPDSPGGRTERTAHHDGSAHLGRASRLGGHDAVGSVFRLGDGLRRGEVILKYLVRQPGAGNLRAGFVVRRNAGSAVRRNRLRRLLREAYRVRRAAVERLAPTDGDLWLVLLWSGPAESVLRPKLERIGNDLDAAIDALGKRLRKRHNAHAEAR